MAEDKKGFILYADQIEIFKQLQKDKAGELIKHIFAYVNDENPITEDLIINLAFTPIKNQFKRDLDKWENTRKKRSEAGKASAEARRNKKEQSLTKSTSVKSVKQTSTKSTVNVKDNVNVNVNVNVNDILINKDKEFIFNEWLSYRKEIKKEIKAKSTLNSLAKKFNTESLIDCKKVVGLSIENNWQGLFWDKIVKTQNNNKPFKPTF